MSDHLVGINDLDFKRKLSAMRNVENLNAADRRIIAIIWQYCRPSDDIYYNPNVPKSANKPKRDIASINLEEEEGEQQQEDLASSNAFFAGINKNKEDDLESSIYGDNDNDNDNNDDEEEEYDEENDKRTRIYDFSSLFSVDNDNEDIIRGNRRN